MTGCQLGPVKKPPKEQIPTVVAVFGPWIYLRIRTRCLMIAARLFSCKCNVCHNTTRAALSPKQRSDTSFHANLLARFPYYSHRVGGGDKPWFPSSSCFSVSRGEANPLVGAVSMLHIAVFRHRHRREEGEADREADAIATKKAPTTPPNGCGWEGWVAPPGM